MDDRCVLLRRPRLWKLHHRVRDHQQIYTPALWAAAQQHAAQELRLLLAAILLRVVLQLMQHPLQVRIRIWKRISNLINLKHKNCGSYRMCLLQPKIELQSNFATLTGTKLIRNWLRTMLPVHNHSCVHEMHISVCMSKLLSKAIHTSFGPPWNCRAMERA